MDMREGIEEEELRHAFDQNEKLVNALYEAREQISSLKEEVDKLTALDPTPDDSGLTVGVNAIAWWRMSLIADSSASLSRASSAAVATGIDVVTTTYASCRTRKYHDDEADDRRERAFHAVLFSCTGVRSRRLSGRLVCSRSRRERDRLDSRHSRIAIVTMISTAYSASRAQRRRARYFAARG